MVLRSSSRLRAKKESSSRVVAEVLAAAAAAGVAAGGEADVDVDVAARGAEGAASDGAATTREGMSDTRPAHSDGDGGGEEPFTHPQGPSSSGAARKATAAAATPSPKKKRRRRTADPGPRAPSADPRSVAARGLPPGALAQCRRTGLVVRAVDGLPPLAKRDGGTDPGAVPLSGRLVVVTADRGGALLHPPEDYVGRTFDAARLPVAAVNYGMIRAADPAFAPWPCVAARLAACGLLPATDAEDGDRPPPLVARLRWDGATLVGASVTRCKTNVAGEEEDSGLLWALIESPQGGRNPSVLLGAPRPLLEHRVESNGSGETGDGGDGHLFPTREAAKHLFTLTTGGDDAVDEGVDATSDGPGDSCGSAGGDLLPVPRGDAARVRLAASLLQKAVRRGTGLCSPAPLLEACGALLRPDATAVPPPAGATLVTLKTLWECMLVDASPFDDGDGCLGLPGLLLLSLVARADPEWTLPAPLRRAAVAGALRTAASAPSKPWLGFVERTDRWWELEEDADRGDPDDPDDRRARRLRDLLRAAQAAVGGRVAWGKWSSFVGDPAAAATLAYLNPAWDGARLPPAPPPAPGDAVALDAWEGGATAPPRLPTPGPRLARLDEECRRAAVDPGFVPASLVLLQACLSRPPVKWRKHSLPALAKQVRKLISEANARHRERVQLARLETWGKERAAGAKAIPLTTSGSKAVSRDEQPAARELLPPTAAYQSFREVVTSSSVLSRQEIELVDCFEAIQKWALEKLGDGAKPREQAMAMAEDALAAAHVASTPEGGVRPFSFRQARAGSPLSRVDGRIGFLLAFAASVEVEVLAPSGKETVSAMFCNDPDSPLLVQRIGRARRQGREAATAGGTTAGATAVPSLGYVQRDRSQEEGLLFAAAEEAVAEHWKGGKTLALPLPPAGLQWDLSEQAGSEKLGWEAKETAVRRTAQLKECANGNKIWHFTIDGKSIDAFDARPVMSPCMLDAEVENDCYRPIPLEHGSERDHLLRIALYAVEVNEDDCLPSGEAVLTTQTKLHALAEIEREENVAGLSEGRVFDWLPLAWKSLVPSRTWRDSLLAIRTREKHHVILGKGIRRDGSGTPLDLSEGVLVRLFHALEFLYPQVVRKEAALKFRIRPRGAAYYHLLASLEMLGRGESSIRDPEKIPQNKVYNEVRGERKQPGEVVETSGPRKRSRRSAAIASSKKTKLLLEEPSAVSKAESVTKADMGDNSEETEEEEYLPLPTIKTTLWPHQLASVEKVVEGVLNGKRGHADASAVGAGKTLTALATIARLAQWIEGSHRTRHGVLVMLPTKALIKEWLLEIATHTEGFHLVEQREDGSLFSLTYGKCHPPIDGNTLVISTLDRVCNHPFVRQAAWDFVVIDECLSVQNAAAKRTPSAWRQIEVSLCGVLMLSATFFRSKYDQLFYMIRMLRSPLPRTIEFLPATIHEHVVCQIPETDRTWQMQSEMVALSTKDLYQYRSIIDAFRRQQINDSNNVDGRRLWVELEGFLRSRYEGRNTRTTYGQASLMGDAFVTATKRLLKKGRRPLIFADTSQEGDMLLRALQKHGLDACTWAEVASRKMSSAFDHSARLQKTVTVAVKTVEGQGINMQGHADAILCRPTPGDHLEQMKGRIDRPGQKRKDLLLVVVVAEHTIEEAKFANIRLAGNFFREYIAPVASKYKERINYRATLAAGGTGKLKAGTVSGTWKQLLQEEGQSGAFADTVDSISSATANVDISNTNMADDHIDCEEKPKVTKEKEEPKYKPLNKVLRNRGDPKAIRQAKNQAKEGKASLGVRSWLFPSKVTRATRQKGLPKSSLMRYSNAVPPALLNRKTIYEAVAHLSRNDSKLAALIARVGADALIRDCGEPKPPTQARLFDRCVRAITYTMVSVDAGNAFLRRLAMKIGTCLEMQASATRNKILNDTSLSKRAIGDEDGLDFPKHLLDLLLDGKHTELTFTHQMMRVLVNECELVKGKRTGYPHICGLTFPCGKNDDHSVFLMKARANVKGGNEPVSAGFSNAKAGFLISLVDDFESGKMSGERIATASDREAARMLLELKGIGDWAASQVLMNFLSRADVMLYGDLTVRNFLNELYDINHQDESETLLESAADFGDTGQNRNMIDDIAEQNRWNPYRSVVCYLMYHLQEENLVLL